MYVKLVLCVIIHFIVLSIRLNDCGIGGIRHQPPIVLTKNGYIQGTHFRTHSKRVIKAYLGVPFAAAPVGSLRFHHAIPHTTWSGIMHTNVTKPPCLQYNHLLMANNEYPIVGSEDCLYLNIYAPVSIVSNRLIPVIVFIHGGAFMFGSSNGFNPRFLLDKNNFVFVTISYRLGPFGFLSTGDNVVPGNNGLKDQVMALKWIKQNIEYFGGDPQEVTIAGLSAGAASVHLHYFSPMSVNLFKRGISLSGSALCPWAQMVQPKEKTTTLAASLNCPTNDSKILVTCLQNRSGVEILSKTKQLFFGWLYNPISPFGPTIEPNNQLQFLSHHPIKLLNKGHVQDLPWLVGFTKEEGLYPASEFILNETLMNQLDENWFYNLPHLLNYNYITSKDKLTFSEQIRNYYFNDKTGSDRNNVRNIVKMTGDRMYVNPIDRSIKLQTLVNRSPVYVYQFGYRGKHSLSNLFTGVTTDVGVSHGDDVAYVLNCYFPCIDDNRDRSMVTTMVNIWSDYARNSTPLSSHGLTWHPVDRNHANRFVKYLYINSSDDLVMLKSSNLGNNEFWNKLKFAENIIMHDEL